MDSVVKYRAKDSCPSILGNTIFTLATAGISGYGISLIYPKFMEAKSAQAELPSRFDWNKWVFGGLVLVEIGVAIKIAHDIYRVCTSGMGLGKDGFMTVGDGEEKRVPYKDLRVADGDWMKFFQVVGKLGVLVGTGGVAYKVLPTTKSTSDCFDQQGFDSELCTRLYWTTIALTVAGSLKIAFDLYRVCKGPLGNPKSSLLDKLEQDEAAQSGQAGGLSKSKTGIPPQNGAAATGDAYAQLPADSSEDHA